MADETPKNGNGDGKSKFQNRAEWIVRLVISTGMVILVGIGWRLYDNSTAANSELIRIKEQFEARGKAFDEYRVTMRDLAVKIEANSKAIADNSKAIVASQGQWEEANRRLKRIEDKLDRR